MKKGGIFVPASYHQNRLFDKDDRVINRDDCNYHMYLLRENWKKRGIELSTQDMYPLEDYDFAIFVNYPPRQEGTLEQLRTLEKDLYLFLAETEMIEPEGWKKENHKSFRKIFTWHDKWIDNRKYVKIFLPNKIPEEIDFSLDKKVKFCTLIAANKLNTDKRELYTERIKAILWFEKNYPEDFDLYGIDWEKGIRKTFLNHFQRFSVFNMLFDVIRRRFPFLSRILFTKYLKSYRGRIKSKRDVLSYYRFAICYENVRNIPGYISEKIFDCFFAGCIPIYLGAPNITDFIPKNIFIDKRKYKSYEELHNYLKNMDDNEYLTYLENIKEFLDSHEIDKFSAGNFVNILTKGVLNDDN